MEFQDLVNVILGFAAAHYDEALAIIGGFAVLARFTPNTTDDRFIQFILDAVNFTGMNHGKAKNAEETVE